MTRHPYYTGRHRMRARRQWRERRDAARAYLLRDSKGTGDAELLRVAYEHLNTSTRAPENWQLPNRSRYDDVKNVFEFVPNRCQCPRCRARRGDDDFWSRQLTI